MNKKMTVFLAVLWLPILSFGQTVTMEKLLKYPKYTFTDTVRMKDIPQEELYARAWGWFNEQSKTDAKFFEEANKRYGRFTGTSSIVFQSKTKGGSDFVKGKIYFLVRVYVQDDYYVYEITDFVHQGRITFNTLTNAPKYPYRPIANQEWHNMVWEEMKVTVKDNVYPLIGSLRASMQKESEQFTQIVSRKNSEIPLEELHNADIKLPVAKPEPSKEKTPVQPKKKPASQTRKKQA